MLLSDVHRMSEPQADSEAKRAVGDAEIGLCRYRLDGTVLDINEAALAFLELQERYPDPASARGKHITELVDDGGQAFGFASEEDRIEGYSWRVEQSFRTVKGNNKWALQDFHRSWDPTTGELCVQVVLRDITERKRLEEDLQRAESRLRQAYDQLQEGFLAVSRQGHIVDCNEAFAQLLGYTKAQLLGRRHEELMPEPWRSQEAQRREELLTPGSQEPVWDDRPYVHHDGQRVWVKSHTHGVQHGDPAGARFWIINRDQPKASEPPETGPALTLAAWAEAAPDVSPALWQSVAELGQLFVQGGDWPLLFEKALSQLGQALRAERQWLLEDAPGEGLTSGAMTSVQRWAASGPVVEPDSVPWGQLLEQLEAGFDGKPFASAPAEQLVSKTHRVVGWIALFPLRLQGQRKGYWVIEDRHRSQNWTATEQQALLANARLLESALLRLHADRERLASEEQVNRDRRAEAVGRLAGGLAHDLNNLLLPIIGYAEMALGDISPDQSLHEDLEQICQAAGKAKKLTQQLLAFGRRQLLQLVEQDLEPLFELLEPLIRRTLRPEYSLEWNLHLTEGRIRIDEDQLEQALAHLVSNAQDAMPQGGVVVFELSEIWVAEAQCKQMGGVQPGHYASLIVRDSGTGMDGEVQSHLFEPFFTTKRKGKGLGLGLASVYGIVRQHGGGIRIQSELQKGTEVQMLFPLLDSD